MDLTDSDLTDLDLTHVDLKHVATTRRESTKARNRPIAVVLVAPLVSLVVRGPVTEAVTFSDDRTRRQSGRHTL